MHMVLEVESWLAIVTFNMTRVAGQCSGTLVDMVHVASTASASCDFGQALLDCLPFPNVLNDFVALDLA